MASGDSRDRKFRLPYMVVLVRKKFLISPGLAFLHPFLLIAFRLCDEDLKSNAFRKRWFSFCWRDHVKPHDLLINPLGAIGSFGATEAGSGTRVGFCKFCTGVFDNQQTSLTASSTSTGRCYRQCLSAPAPYQWGSSHVWSSYWKAFSIVTHTVRNTPYGMGNVKMMAPMLSSLGPNERLNLTQLSKTLTIHSSSVGDFFRLQCLFYPWLTEEGSARWYTANNFGRQT